MNMIAAELQAELMNEIEGEIVTETNKPAEENKMVIPEGFKVIQVGDRREFVPVGTPVAILKDVGNDTFIAEFQGQKLASGARDRVISTVTQGLSAKVRKAGVRHLHEDGIVIASSAGPNMEDAEGKQQVLDAANKKFNAQNVDVNIRFNYLARMLSTVLRGKNPSVVITGRGGLGKSHSVKTALKKHGFINARETVSDSSMMLDENGDAIISASGKSGSGREYVIISGHITPRNLYRTLYQHQNDVVIFDDCDVNDRKSCDLLKAALDSVPKRIVSWGSDAKDNDLPNHFEFSGQVIMISNREQDQIDQAVRTRSFCVNLSMTSDQIIERMRFILNQTGDDSFMPEVDMETKHLALQFIDNMRGEIPTLSMRTLRQAVVLIQSFQDDNEVVDEEFVRFMLLTNSES